VAAPSGATKLASSATAKRTQSVSIFDNAFYRGGDRPTVRLRAGGVLTWRFASQQSHQVTVRSGPALVRSPPQAAGAWSARLKRPGTYEFVCAIHAPGMRMTAVVVK
jgi:plastocyanin